MATLAPKLPWQHPFAGGYPRRGGQPLPTDPDAIDYLNRVKAADGGVSVEVGIAQAIDAFVRGCKADSAGYAGDPTRSNWDAIKASCIMCGARTLSGALVPLKGTAPTSYNFVAADYDRSGGGLKGDGSTKYLDSNRANDADGQNDNHNSVYASSGNTIATALLIASDPSATLGGNQVANVSAVSPTDLLVYSRNSVILTYDNIAGGFGASGFQGISRSTSAEFSARCNGNTESFARPSATPTSSKTFVFDRGPTGGAVPTDARLAFYSIGSALDLAALDTRVSTLVAAIAAAL